MVSRKVSWIKSIRAVKTRTVATGLAIYLFSVGAMLGATFSADQVERVHRGMNCIFKSVSEMDDGISSADIVARSIVNSCSDAFRDKSHPGGSDSLQFVQQEQAIEDGLRESALERLLKLRVLKQKRPPAENPSANFFMGQTIERTQLSNYTLTSDNYFELSDGGRETGIRVIEIKSNQLKVISQRTVTPFANSVSCVKASETQSSALSDHGYKLTAQPADYFKKNFGIKANTIAGAEFELDNNKGLIFCIEAGGKYLLERRDGLHKEEMAAYLADMKANAKQQPLK